MGFDGESIGEEKVGVSDLWLNPERMIPVLK